VQTVFQRVRDPATRVVYAASLLVGTAYGVSIALTALRLKALGFDKPAIGSLAAVFACGIIVTSLPMGLILRRVSAKTVLLVSLAGYAACVGVFPFLQSGAAIATARFFDGAFSVATWVCFETVLLRRAEAHQKAYVMSLYAIAVALGYVVGPVAAQGIAAFAPMRMAFLASSVLALAACVVVATRLDRASAERPIAGEGRGAGSAPQVPEATLLVLRRIRTSLFGTFAYGYFQSSVVLFLPLYLIESKGVAESRTILMPAFFAAGMLLFSNHAGKVGDRTGYLRVMRTLGAIGAVMVAGFVWLTSWPLMCVAFFVAGATLAAISPVSLALQGRVVDAASYARANSLYNAFYAAGMLLGPPVSSLLFARHGGSVMLLHLAALWTAFVAFTVVFWKDDPAAQAMKDGPGRAAYPELPTDPAAP
jgi:predicted MFS family arabinose efflux permease